MRAGFLFNHYLSYQVPHGAPIAFELSRLRPDWRVELLFSGASSYAEAQRIGSVYPGHRCRFRLLPRAGISALLSDCLPALHRPLTLLGNLKLLASFDALIAPEKNYLMLKGLPSFRSSRFIGLCHGPVTQPRSFNKGRLKFDCLLVPGEFDYRHFKDEAPEKCCEIVGHPKFEALQKLAPETLRLFDNDRPVALYTPHHHRRYSSWLPMGREVLRFFADSDRYNLVFAPHVRLFQGRAGRGNISLDDFRDASNILLDIGSERSVDMSYTRAAHLYLGDVSSQVYEFLYYRRRPCVFLNPSKLDPAQMNFWQAGPVIDSIARLQGALTQAEEQFNEKYRNIQTRLIDTVFTTGDPPPSQRGAEAIIRFLTMRARVCEVE